MKKLFVLFLNLHFLLFAADPLLFIVNGTQSEIEIYNIQNNTFQAPITYGGFLLGSGDITFNNDLTKIYVTNFIGNFISVFDGTTYTHLGDFGSDPNLIHPEELAFSLDGSTLYVANYGKFNEESVSVYTIDPTTGLGVFSHSFGGNISSSTSETSVLTLNGLRNRLYLVSSATNNVSVFDLPSETVIGEFSDPSLDFVYGGFYHALEDKLYLTNAGNNTISVFQIDPTTGLGTLSQVFGSATELDTPEDIVFSGDYTKIYVGNNANFVTEYDSQGNFVQKIIVPGKGAVSTGVTVNSVQTAYYFTHASAFTIYDEFLLDTSIYNQLSWNFSNPSSVLNYQVFRKEGAVFKLLKTISGRGPLKFVDNKIKKGKVYEYKIVANVPGGSVEETVFSVKK